MSASVIVGDGALDFVAFHGAHRDFRQDFEHGGELQVAARLDLDGFDGGTAHRTQVFLGHRIGVGLADQFIDGIAAHLVAVLLLDDLQRHLALAEAADVGGARQVAQAAIHLAGHARVGNLDLDPAPEAGGVRHCKLHRKDP